MTGIGGIGSGAGLGLIGPEAPILSPNVQAPNANAPSLEIAPVADAQQDAAPSFESIFSKMINEASAKDNVAATKIDALASGASDDIHGTMIASKEAEISVKMVATIRNRLIDAFHEIWRTSV
jgi:flagellar hook-basal body complex protein FliE